MISKNQKINEIFRQFLYANKLKFSEIEKKTGIRSNELAYLIKRMLDDNVLLKKDDNYLVTEEYEKKIPLFSENSESTPLAVVLVACVNENKVLLIKRKKRAYKDYWSMPGGRIRTGETISQAALRVLKEKTFVDGKFVSINAVVHEQYGKKDNVKNAFMLFFVKMTPLNDIKEKEDVKWCDNFDNLDIIPSDKWLIENKLNETIDVKEELLDEKSGKLEINFIN